MNIIEAFRSGRPVRRRSDLRHIGSDGKGWVDPTFMLRAFPLDLEDILADDWEVHEKSVEITRTQLVAAYAAAHVAPRPSDFLERMALELGL